MWGNSSCICVQCACLLVGERGVAEYIVAFVGFIIWDNAYVGTDGIRGRVGEAPITPDFMLKLGWACGRVFARGREDKEERCTVVIGKDTRVSGYMFESALEAGLVAAGVDVDARERGVCAPRWSLRWSLHWDTVDAGYSQRC